MSFLLTNMLYLLVPAAERSANVQHHSTCYCDSHRSCCLQHLIDSKPCSGEPLQSLLILLDMTEEVANRKTYNSLSSLKSKFIYTPSEAPLNACNYQEWPVNLQHQICPGQSGGISIISVVQNAGMARCQCQRICKTALGIVRGVNRMGP